MVRALAVLVLLLVPFQSGAAPAVEARGLMRDMAVLVIDGQQRLVRAGLSVDGVTLLSADPSRAVVLIDGERYELGLSQRAGGSFVRPETREVRIVRDGRGHFRVGGRIEGQPVSFLVDTGATVLAMSSAQADRLRIDYSANGQAGQVLTAAGPAVSHRVRLNAVEVCGILINGVDAAVVEGSYPVEILLGMSFLRNVGFSERAGVLTLTQDF